MARTDSLDNYLTDVAEAIRNKKGTTEPISASEFDTEISSIQSGDVSEYFDDTISYKSSNSIRPWMYLIKKIPSINVSEKITTLASAFAYFFGKEIDLSSLDTTKVTDMNSMFQECQNLTKLDLSHFDTTKVITMSNMFYNCQNLTTLDLSNFDTSNVTNMGYMFYNCQNLTTLDLSNFDTSNVTNMGYMFYNCQNLTTLDISHFNTSKNASMRNMFDNCKNLITLNLSHFDTSKVTDMYCTFQNCKNLTTLDLSSFDTSKVTDMRYMFTNCQNLTSLDFKKFDFTNVSDMGYTFWNCGLEEIILYSNSNRITNMNGCFRSMSNLRRLDLSNFDTSKVKNMDSMLTKVYSSDLEMNNLEYVSEIDTQSVTTIQKVFTHYNKSNGYKKFTYFGGFKNLGKGYTSKTNNSSYYTLDISNCQALTHESLMNVINKIYDLNLTYDVANGGTLYHQKLILGPVNLEKLTEEEIAIATNKGWTVS